MLSSLICQIPGKYHVLDNLSEHFIVISITAFLHYLLKNCLLVCNKAFSHRDEAKLFRGHTQTLLLNTDETSLGDAVLLQLMRQAIERNGKKDSAETSP